jgi:lipocalin
MNQNHQEIRAQQIWMLILAGLLGACQSAHPPMDVVADVNLERYTGKWYEIASFPS